MSTVVASYTPVVRRCPAPRVSSGIPAAIRSWRPAAAFPASAAVKCRRPLSATRALPEKHRPAFNIPPTALLYPVPPTDAKERWDIRDEGKQVKLWFQVPGLSEEDIEIVAAEDMLEIKRKDPAGTASALADAHGVGSFHVRLLMTKEYSSGGITAELKAGMLEVTISRAEQEKRSLTRVGWGTQTGQTMAPAANPADAERTKPQDGAAQTQRNSKNSGSVNNTKGQQ